VDGKKASLIKVSSGHEDDNRCIIWWPILSKVKEYHNKMCLLLSFFLLKMQILEKVKNAVTCCVYAHFLAKKMFFSGWVSNIHKN
jgi:hypothetical protein